MIDQREAFEERAAIIQFGSGLPRITREESERIAAAMRFEDIKEVEF